MNLFFLKVLRRLRLAGLLNVTGNRSMLGSQMRLPIQGGLGWDLVSETEEWMAMLLQSLQAYFQASADRAFLDVGVNVGQTLIKYRAVVPGGAYIGFEPNPACVAYVAKLIELNGWQDIDLYPVGVSESAGLCELNFFHGSDVESSASILADFRPGEPITKRSHVALFPLHMIELRRPISFLKIDVEGAELEVLRGSETMLRRDRPLVSIEILPCYDASNEFRIQRQQEVEVLMRDIAYQCFRVQKSGALFEKLAGLEPIESIGVHSDLHLSDYLWVPEEQSQRVLALVMDDRNQ